LKAGEISLIETTPKETEATKPALMLSGKIAESALLKINRPSKLHLGKSFGFIV